MVAPTGPDAAARRAEEIRRQAEEAAKRAAEAAAKRATEKAAAEKAAEKTAEKPPAEKQPAQTPTSETPKPDQTKPQYAGPPQSPGAPPTLPPESERPQHGPDAKANTNLSENIDALDSKGDFAVSKSTAEGSLGGNIRFFKVDGSASNGSEIKVTRDSDDPNSTYTIRYEKENTAGLSAGTGTDQLTKLKVGGGAESEGTKSGGPSANAKIDKGIGTHDTVEMKFANKEEAKRAAEVLQKLQLADGLDDATTGAKVQGKPFERILPDGLVDGGINPLANPLNSDGAPSGITKKAAGVSEDDLAFVKSKVTAYEQTASTTTGFGLDAKTGDMLKAGFDGKSASEQRFTRRVELPQGDTPGSVTYSAQGKVALTAKEKAGLDIAGVVNGGVTNKSDITSTTHKVSVKYDLPGWKPDANVFGRPLPEVDAANGKTEMKFAEASVETKLDITDQDIGDSSRRDGRVVTVTGTVKDASKLGGAAEDMLNGRFEEAARKTDASVTVKNDYVDRSGADTQVSAGFDAKVVQGSVALNTKAGVDDIVQTTSKTFAPSKPDEPGAPKKPDEPPKKPDEPEKKHYSVDPYRGANVREVVGEDGKKLGTIQQGSFVTETGEKAIKDKDGKEWRAVSGTDENDKPIKGWVRGDLLKEHSPELGAMDGQGRINPTRERENYDEVKIRKDDNLYNIAKEHGWDYKDTLAANKDHITRPELVFAGDTVYVPKSAR